MSTHIELHIVTPEKAAYSGRVSEVVLPGRAGELGVLPGHRSLVTLVKPGAIKAVGTDNISRFFAVGSGFAEVHEDRVTVLVGACDGSDEIDVEIARQRIAEYEAELGVRDFETPEELAAHTEELERNRARMQIIEAATKK
jgi:F-type H+-transporting ATPase subunit epsilon